MNKAAARKLRRLLAPKRFCKCGCGEEISPTRPIDTVFFNQACRKRYYRAQQRAAQRKLSQ